MRDDKRAVSLGSHWHWLSAMLIAAACCSVKSAILAQTPAAAPQLGTPHRTEPQPKEFVLTRHYKLREARYTPPALVALVKPQPAQPVDNTSPAAEPPHYSTAEQVLVAQLIAMKTGDLDTWLKTWDPAAQQMIVDHDNASKQGRALRLRQWRDRLRTVEAVLLVRWIVTGPYVIVTYVPASATMTPVKPTSAETPTAFHLDGGRWRATLDLEHDPVFLHFNDTRTTWEQTVR